MRALFLSLLCVSVFAIQHAYAQPKSCATIERDVVNKKDYRIKAFDTTGRGLADNYFIWDNGVTLRVKFLSGSQALRRLILQYAKEWEQYANVKLQLVTTGDADIRVMPGKDVGHWSYIGTQCRLIGQTEKTMSLDTSDFSTLAIMRRTVLHEFGHSLGLLHEHSSPISGIQWDSAKVYSWYLLTNGWDKDMVNAQVFEVYKESYTNGTKYDSKSIMHYPIQGFLTKTGYTTDWNNDLSIGDRQLISMLYPKIGQRSSKILVPRAKVTEFTKLAVVENDQKGGLSLFPTFTVTVADKPGKVYLVAEFFDKDGKPLFDHDNDYAYNGDVAAIQSIFLFPGLKTAYNKTTRDFEMFIPYNQVELPEKYKLGQESKLLLLFHVVYLTDEGDLKEMFAAQNFAPYSLSQKFLSAMKTKGTP